MTWMSSRSMAPGRSSAPARPLAVVALALLLAAAGTPAAAAEQSMTGESCDPWTPAPTSSRPGSYVVRDTFETGLSNWSVTDEGDAWVGIFDLSGVSSPCSARLIVSSSDTSRANLRTWLPSGTADVWASGTFRILKEGYSGSNVPTFRFFDGSHRILDVHRQNQTGQLWLRTSRGDGSWNYVYLNKWIELGRWFNVEVHVRTAWSSSDVEVYINGVRHYSNWSYSLPTGRLTTAMIGAEHVRQKMDMLVDKVVVKGS